MKHDMEKHTCKGVVVITLMEVLGWKGPYLRGEKVDDVSGNSGCVEERGSVKDSRGSSL